MTDEQKVREAFEAWASICGFDLTTIELMPSVYRDADTCHAYDGWQAALAWKGTAEECSVVAKDAFTLMRFIFRHFGDVSMAHHLTDEVVQATRRIEAMAEKSGVSTTDTKPIAWFDSLRVGTNSGHGHAWARPDGMKARCGGPALCSVCARDQAIAAKAGA